MFRTSSSLTMLFALALLGAPLPALANDTASNWLDHDANGDGRLSRDEIDAARGGRAGQRQEPRQRRLDRYDTDSDGAISRDERRSAREARDAHRAERGQRGGGGAHAGGPHGGGRGYGGPRGGPRH